jgi:LysR family transcriptional regulator, transcriptional activator for bauABCD operon
MSFNRLPNLTDNDILLLQVFNAVVEAGSFTGAELTLNKSKSAISVYISKLETRLGKKLCHRGRSGFSLTPEGQQIYEICRDLFADLDRFRDRISRVTTLLGGTLSISFDDDLIGHDETLARALASFKSVFPQVYLSISTSSAERIMQTLLDTTVDIGVCAIPREMPGAVVFPLYEQELGLYCGRSHPLFDRDTGILEEDALAEFEAVDVASYHEGNAQAAMEPFHLTARSGQFGPRLILIQTGKMIGLLPREIGAVEERAGNLREIRTRRPLKQKGYAVIRREVAASRVCKQMLASLQSAFAA